ncbi:MAG TPA: acetylglutamate kinase [Microthrixaceae bacterium]|nr:acetylglutamate kinase [Microthrixaceae bacterium]
MNQQDPMTDPTIAVDVLLQALPYIEKFRGSVVVVKFGGNAMSSPELFGHFAKDIVMMHRVGMKPVVVHGGGPQIGEWLRRVGKETEFVDGRRVTDSETLEIAQMVLLGKVNSEIVTALNTYGPVALGLSGTDAMLLTAEARDDALGFVGTVTKVNPELIARTLMMDLIPVIATIGADSSGQTYNINADDAATAIAQKLKAEKLIFLTDVPGLLADVNDPDSLMPSLNTDEVVENIANGVIQGGMIPKMRACVESIEAGVESAHLIDGRVPHVLLLELLTNAGVGTMISNGDVPVESAK